MYPILRAVLIIIRKKYPSIEKCIGEKIIGESLFAD